MEAPLAIGKRNKVDADETQQQRQQMQQQPLPSSPKRLKTDTFCFLPFHLKVLKSLYNNNDNTNIDADNASEIKEAPLPGNDETWEMATRFLNSRDKLWQAKQEALRCRAVSTQAQNYAQDDVQNRGSSSRKIASNNRRRQQHRHCQQQRRPLYVPAIMLRQPLFTTTTSAASAVVAPLFLPPHQQEMILSTTTATPAGTSRAINTCMMSPPFKVMSGGQLQQQQPKTKTSFRIVAALLQQQSSLVQEDLEMQIKPFRPLLDMAEKRIAWLVTSLQEQRRAVLEMEELKMDDLLLVLSTSTSTSTSLWATAASRHRRSSDRHSCHDDMHQPKQGGGVEPDEQEMQQQQQQQQQQNSYLAATKSKICLWNMLALDLKAIIISSASSEDD